MIALASVHSDHEYYGPTRQAVAQLNELFAFQVSGKEQDWEIELADADRIDEFVGVLENESLNLETKSALSLLLVHSLEDAICESREVSDQVTAIRGCFLADERLMQRIKSYLKRGEYISETYGLLR